MLLYRLAFLTTASDAAAQSDRSLSAYTYVSLATKPDQCERHNQRRTGRKTAFLQATYTAKCCQPIPVSTYVIMLQLLMMSECNSLLNQRSDVIRWRRPISCAAIYWTTAWKLGSSVFVAAKNYLSLPPGVGSKVNQSVVSYCYIVFFFFIFHIFEHQDN